MKVSIMAFAAVAMTFGITHVANAQDQQAAAPTQYQDLEDVAVFSGDGNRIGEIETLLLDQQGGLAYVVEIEEGFLGLRDTEVVIPATRLSYDAQNRRFSTDVAETEIQGLQTWED